MYSGLGDLTAQSSPIGVDQSQLELVNKDYVYSDGSPRIMTYSMLAQHWDWNKYRPDLTLQQLADLARNSPDEIAWVGSDIQTAGDLYKEDVPQVERYYADVWKESIDEPPELSYYDVYIPPTAAPPTVITPEVIVPGSPSTNLPGGEVISPTSPSGASPAASQSPLLWVALGAAAIALLRK